MLNTNRYGIVLSFLALWINTNFSFEYQQITGFVGIFLFGILHGSNDLALITKIKYNKSKNSFKKILINYILVVLVGVLLFYCVPSLALSLFILFSGYHFGEQHWGFLKDAQNKLALTTFQTVYGLFIFALLFYFHEMEVKVIVSQIINYSINFVHFSYLVVAFGIALIVAAVNLNRFSSNFKNEIVLNIFYILVFAVVFKTADLIWAFAIYFVVWHSIPSIKEQVNYLYGDFTLKNFIIYFKSAFPYWIISLFGIVLLYYTIKDKQLFNALFFSLLAAITFPHTIIIIKMQNNK